MAAIKGDLEQLNKLLEQGVNPNVADFAGNYIYIINMYEYKFIININLRLDTITRSM